MNKNLFKIRTVASLLSAIIIILAFSGLSVFAKYLSLQVGPNVARLFSDFGFAALISLVLILLITFLFGRWYCSVICPLGLIQEVELFILRKKYKGLKHYSWISYLIAAIAFGFVAAGNVYLLRFTEPYTLFGEIYSLSVIGIVFVVIVFVLVVFKARFFCSSLCPVGAILNLFSKFSIFGIQFDKSRCISCKMCMPNCPVGCIDIDSGRVDNSVCVKCLRCVGACSKGVFYYGKAKSGNIKFNPKRRQFIAAVSMITVFAAACKLGLTIKQKTAKAVKRFILPPGANSCGAFINKCLNCNLCVKNCPNDIIKKADSDFDAVHIDFSKNHCDFECKKCSDVCPAGALKKMRLTEKQKMRIAVARFDENKCVGCGECVKKCPTGAIKKLSDVKMPEYDVDKCIGCGLCSITCSKHYAIKMIAVKEQKLLG